MYMSTTSSTTLDIFHTVVLGVGDYLANSAIYLLVFAFMFGMFTSIIIILAGWRTR